jgi:ATP-dependent DNA helicase PIF1
MLNEMREGKLSQQSIAKFRTLNRELNFEDMLSATELYVSPLLT